VLFGSNFYLVMFLCVVCEVLSACASIAQPGRAAAL
jgi:hypothetical protein